MKSIIPVVLFAALLYGCKGEPGPAGPSLPGSISGSVRLIDSSGVRMSDNSGAVISIESIPTTAISNAMGLWTISGLLTGSYNITISKPGFDSNKYYGFQFVGGGGAQLYPSYLHQLPTFDVQNISVSRDSPNIAVSGTISSTLGETLILFWGRNKTVSSDPAQFLSFSFIYVPRGSSSFSDLVGNRELYPYGITSGDTVYVVAYPSTNGGWNSYVDPVTGRDVITSIRPIPSNIDSVVVP